MDMEEQEEEEVEAKGEKADNGKKGKWRRWKLTKTMKRYFKKGEWRAGEAGGETLKRRTVEKEAKTKDDDNDESKSAKHDPLY